MTPVDLNRKNDPDPGGGDAGFQGLGDCGEVRVSGILVGLPEGWVTAWKILGLGSLQLEEKVPVERQKTLFSDSWRSFISPFLRLVHFWMSNISMNFEF